MRIQIRIRIFTYVRVRNLTFHFDGDPGPSFHNDANPYPYESDAFLQCWPTPHNSFSVNLHGSRVSHHGSRVSLHGSRVSLHGFFVTSTTSAFSLWSGSGSGCGFWSESGFSKMMRILIRNTVLSFTCMLRSTFVYILVDKKLLCWFHCIARIPVYQNMYF